MWQIVCVEMFQDLAVANDKELSAERIYFLINNEVTTR